MTYIVTLGKAKGTGSLGGGRGKNPGSSISSYHVYADMNNHIKYNATLVRQTITKRNEKIRLTIYKSNNKPHTFATEWKHSRIGIRFEPQLLAPRGGNLETAISVFKVAFKEIHGGVGKMEPRQRQNRVVKGRLSPHHARGGEASDDREHGMLNTSAKGLVVSADDQLVGGDQVPGKDIKEMAGVVNDAFAEHVSTALVHSQSNPDVVALD